VAPAQVSEQAEREAVTQRNEDGEPAHSFQTLLTDLATIANNRIQVIAHGATNETLTFDRITHPTSLQQEALDLLGVRL
jgi:hypothetical protein